MNPPYIKEIAIDSDLPLDEHLFPFSIAAIRKLRSLTFSAVTFFVGENGMGKSILLEAIATHLGIIAQEEAQSVLHRHMRSGKTYTKPDETHYLSDPSSNARNNSQRQHGEALMTLLTQKLQSNGLYLFDEPESSLSPSRQLNALIAMHKLVKNNSQLIIATQSPIFLAYPKAKIYKLDREGIKEIWYENTDHHRIMKETMNYPGEMLRVLLK
jgi:predicted ATPase